MSRVPKWKHEKAKAKVVFRLQFHATHVPQPGWDKLFVSFIPLETGKVIAKTTKATVRSGSCKWSDPIYETTRLFHDTRTKKYDEKLYRIVVAMGTSRSSILGEVIINLSEYADAVKPSTISLPLEDCEFGTILHVTLQLLTSKTGFREFEQQREVGHMGVHTNSDHGNSEHAERVRVSTRTASAQKDKVDIRARVKPHSRELPSLQEVEGCNHDSEFTGIGFDGSSCASESMSTERSDVAGLPEVGSMSAMSSVGGRLPFAQTAQPVKEQQHHHCGVAEGSNDFTHGWASGYSVDNEYSGIEEQNALHKILEQDDSSVSDIRNEMSSLQALSHELDEETKSIAQQLEGELAFGGALAKEVSLLKAQCLEFKSNTEELKQCQTTTIDQFAHPSPTRFFVQTSTTSKIADLGAASVEGRHGGMGPMADAHKGELYLQEFQMKWLQSLTLIEGKVKDIRSKTQHLCHGTSLDILSAEFQTLESVLQSTRDGVFPTFRSSGIVQGNGLNGLLEAPLQTLEELNCKQHPEKDFDRSTQERISELVSELELSKIEQENLTKKMNQMENYYEALIQELEESHRQTSDELNILRSEHSTCFYAISSLQGQVEKVHQDMNGQLSRFLEERHSLNSLSKEFERRANASEAMLRRIRRNYSAAVDRLQKDLELLSGQVLSLFQTNENLAKQAFAEASQLLLYELPGGHSDVVDVNLHEHLQQKIQGPCLQPSESPPVDDSLMQHGNNLRQHHLARNRILSSRGCAIHTEEPTSEDADHYVDRLKMGKPGELCHVQDTENSSIATGVKNTVLPQACNLRSQFDGRASCKGESLAFLNERLAKEGLTGEERKRIIYVLDDFHMQTEAELSEMLVVVLRLEIYSKVLQETVQDKLCDTRGMKEEITKLSCQLGNLTVSNESLMAKLQDTLKSARMLTENEARHAAECDDMTSRYHLLEAKLKDVSNENSLLSEKVAEWYKIIMECKDFEPQHVICDAESKEPGDSFRYDVQSTCIQGELTSIVEEYKALKKESAKQSSAVDHLTRILFCVSEKLRDIFSSITSYDKHMNESTFTISLELERENYVEIMMSMEQYLQALQKEIVKLCQEKDAMEEQRNLSQTMLNSTESNLQEHKENLSFSNAHVEKIQLELQELMDKLRLASDAENIHAKKNRDLSERNTDLEFELQTVITENGKLAKRLFEFENEQKELERIKSIMVDLTSEKEALMLSLKAKDQSLAQLQDELCSLKDKLSFLDDELNTEKDFNKDLEYTISDLKFQLDEKTEQLVILDKQEAEIANLRLQLSDMEATRSSLQNLLLQNEEYQKELIGEVTLLKSKISDLENSICFVSEKLQGLCCSMASNVMVPNEFASLSVKRELEIKNYVAMVTHFEQVLQWIDKQFHEHILEKKDMEVERDNALYSSNAFVKKLQLEVEDISEKLRVSMEAEREHHEKNRRLSSKVTLLEYELQLARSETREVAKKIVDFESTQEELEKAKSSVTDYMHEKEKLILTLEKASYEAAETKNELDILQERVKYADSEIQSGQVLRGKLDDTILKLEFQLNEKCHQLLCSDEQKSEIPSLKMRISELQLHSSRLQNLLLESDEIQGKLNEENFTFLIQVSYLENELLSLIESSNIISGQVLQERGRREGLESKIADLILQLNERGEQLLCVDEQKAEVFQLRQQVLDTESQISDLHQILSDSQACNKRLNSEVLSYHSQVSDLENDLRNTKESLLCISEELQSERGLKEELESLGKELRCQLVEKEEKLSSFFQQKEEFCNVRSHVSVLQAEKFELQQQLLQIKDSDQKLKECNSFLQIEVTKLESQLSAMHDHLLTEEVKVDFISSQFKMKVMLLVNELNKLETYWNDLSEKGLTVVGSQISKARQDKSIQEVVWSATDPEISNYESEIVKNGKGDGSTKYSTSDYSQIDNFDNCFATIENFNRQLTDQKSGKIKKQREILQNLKDEIDGLTSSRDELDIIAIVLKSKLDEQRFQMSLHESDKVELGKLREQQNELSRRLSEQMFKTEEFKNLSIHFKELKDKADSEHMQACEKKESEGSSGTAQESLRMVFIKEQCETQVQELRNKLQISNRHADELLVKLQNALDEIEMRKRNEVSHFKRIEELSVKLSELEAELQKVKASRRELITVFDEMKAELECSSISLDCCKEEKTKLENQLRECNDERTKNRVELDLMKRRMEILTSAADILDKEDQESGLGSTSFEQLLGDGSDHQSHAPSLRSLNNGEGTDMVHLATQRENCTVSGDNLDRGMQCLQNTQEKVDMEEQIKEHENLKTSLERLQSELEKMKNDNLASVSPSNEKQPDSEIQSLQREMAQLNMANEHLMKIFPSFKEFAGSRSSLERVLALELELADALQTRTKSDVHFQSSFLKQHGDEEAIFRSFRDINDLIKDMLQLKGKYSALETELKEMHDRYSDLSIQFAEVEGERQKLSMTLKNRTPRKHRASSS